MMRGNALLVSLVEQCPELAMSVIVLAELRFGFKFGNKYDQNEALLQQFLSDTRIAVLEVDDITAEYYVELALVARKSGIAVGANDLWIAALAWQHGYRLLTKDQDFKIFEKHIKLLGI